MFLSCLVVELISWLVMETPAGIFFDAVPNFVFTLSMLMFYLSPVVCILYWIGLGWKYWRNPWGKLDALACAVSIIVFLPKALFITLVLAGEN